MEEPIAPASNRDRPASGNPSWIVFGIMALAVIVVITTIQFAVSTQRDTELSGSTAAFHPDGWEGESATFDRDLYNPVPAGEPLPEGYRPILARDGIRPIYDPLFVAAEASPWPKDELIIGVEIDGDARAYPVGFLTRREIVLDMHRGIPTFVTW